MRGQAPPSRQLVQGKLRVGQAKFFCSDASEPGSNNLVSVSGWVNKLVVLMGKVPLKMGLPSFWDTNMSMNFGRLGMTHENVLCFALIVGPCQSVFNILFRSCSPLFRLSPRYSQCQHSQLWITTYRRFNLPRVRSTQRQVKDMWTASTGTHCVAPGHSDTKGMNSIRLLWWKTETHVGLTTQSYLKGESELDTQGQRGMTKHHASDLTSVLVQTKNEVT